MSLTIDIHALQSLPPSLINRDDTGAPKSAIFGGVPRQRVSSQSWKRAIRKYFETTIQDQPVGFRTKRVVDLVVSKILELDESGAWDEARAAKETTGLFTTAGIKLAEPKAKKSENKGEETEETQSTAAQTGYLLFLSPRQILHTAQAIIEADGAKIAKKQAKELLNSDHSVDIAMFGRMVADDANYNVDASVQVAHAIGIHESEPEFDYFTAVDDLREDELETGAGMIGTVQMMSSTLYRFATVNFDLLTENLGDAEAARKATVAFVQAFIESLPTGKQNTFANNTLPELVYLVVRKSRSISLVNAFEEPVHGTNEEGRRQEGAHRLADEAREIQEQYGFVPEAAFVIGLGALRRPFEGLATETTLPELGGLLSTAITEGEK